MGISLGCFLNAFKFNDAAVKTRISCQVVCKVKTESKLMEAELGTLKFGEEFRRNFTDPFSTIKYDNVLVLAKLKAVEEPVSQAQNILRSHF